MACAIVTDAGTPKRCWAASAPGAIWLMNACCDFVPGVAAAGTACCRYGADVRLWVGGVAVPVPDGCGAAPASPAATAAPGMSALACAVAPPEVLWAGALGAAVPVAAPPGAPAPAVELPVGPVPELDAGATTPGIAASCGWADERVPREVPAPVAGPGAAAGAPLEAAVVSPRWPLSTNPSTPCCASGSGKEWALTERLGSESAPIVSSAPLAELVTTSTCPSNTTQSPGCGWYPSPSGCQRWWACASWTIDVTPSESGLGLTRTSAHSCSGHGYVAPPLTQLCCPTAWAASSRVRLANAAQDGPWSAPSTLSLPQISASI